MPLREKKMVEAQLVGYQREARALTATRLEATCDTLAKNCCGTMVLYLIKMCYLYFNKMMIGQ